MPGRGRTAPPDLRGRAQAAPWALQDPGAAALAYLPTSPIDSGG